MSVYWIFYTRYSTLDILYWIFYTGYLILGVLYWIFDVGYSVLDLAGGRVESKAGAEQAKAPPAVKSAPQAGKDSKATQRRPDSKVVAPSPAKVLGGKASERIGSSSRREVVVAKQAGQKRHSRSPVRSRSPKRRASLPDKRTPGGLLLPAGSLASLHVQ